MPDGIVQWLNRLQLGRYADAFLENDIDLEILPTLTVDDLRDLGVISVGHRRRIMNALAEMAMLKKSLVSTPALAEMDRRMVALPERSRRQVTVLFADLSGFTGLSAAIDAEETHALLNRFFAAVGEVVSRYGGTVDKHIGDAVMALFGAPVAHTDDPERALRAAYDIHAAVAALNPPLHVHIGVAAGQVIASATGSTEFTEYTVTGDSVNLAARLTDLAETDQTLVSASVRRALGDAFVGENIGEKLIQGQPEPVLVWRLDRIIDAKETGQRPFVGRVAERARFREALTRCTETSRGSVHVVRGEAGIGKTRLLAEFDRMARAEGYATHAGVVLDFGTAKGQDAVRVLTRSLLGLPPNADEKRRAAAAVRAVSDGRLGEEQLAYLNDLLDVEQPPALRGIYDAMDNVTRIGGKRATLATLVESASHDCPILLKIEDLHWADPIILDHAATLAQATVDAPVILLLTTRSSNDPLDGAWRESCGKAEILPLTLGPISAADADLLARSFEGIDEKVLRTCVERAGGNPLLLEQLLYNADEVAEGVVPGSVQTIVQARLDALPNSERLTLHAAAVLGQRFSPAAVEAMLPEITFAAQALQDQALIRPSGGDYQIAHALIRDAVYGSLLTRQRADLHRRAALYFRERDPDLHAQHLDYAGDPDAPSAYLAAAWSQREKLRLEAAVRNVRRALELEPPPDLWFELICLQGDLLRELGAVEESVALFNQALAAATEDRQALKANLGLAEGHRLLNRFEVGMSEIDAAIAIGHRTEEYEKLSHACFLKGNFHFLRGDVDLCLDQHNRALDYADKAGDKGSRVRALGGLADAFYLRGQMQSANRYAEQCVREALALNLVGIAAANQPLLAGSYLYGLELEHAISAAAEGFELSGKTGNKRAEVTSALTASYLSIERGAYQEALEWADTAKALAETAGFIGFAGIALRHQASAYLEMGEAEASHKLAEHAWEIIEAQKFQTYAGAWCLGVLIRACQRADRRSWAIQEGRSLLANGAPSHNHFYFLRDLMEHGIDHADWELVERSAAELDAYTAAERIPWVDFFVARANLLSRLKHSDPDARTAQEVGELVKVAEQCGLGVGVQRLRILIE